MHRQDYSPHNNSGKVPAHFPKQSGILLLHKEYRKGLAIDGSSLYYYAGTSHSPGSLAWYRSGSSEGHVHFFLNPASCFHPPGYHAVHQVLPAFAISVPWYYPGAAAIA